MAILDKFEELHRVKRPERFGPNAVEWFFHQDNAPAHKSGDTMTWLEVSGYKLIAHSPYSPDLAVSVIVERVRVLLIRPKPLRALHALQFLKFLHNPDPGFNLIANPQLLP